jgi:hypothetical protein
LGRAAQPFQAFDPNLFFTVLGLGEKRSGRKYPENNQGQQDPPLSNRAQRL